MTPRTATIIASPSPKLAIWSKPEKGVIKINCNAVVSTTRSVIATVARDWRGSLVFTLTKIVEIIVLYSKGHIESDAKSVLNPLGLSSVDLRESNQAALIFSIVVLS